MENDNTFLRFSGYEYHLADAVNESLLFNLFTDVTLVSDEGKYFKAHKLVLSSGSFVLDRILQTHPTKDQELFIYFPGVQYQDLKAMLDYMFLGQVSVGQEKSENFMQFTRHMGLKGLLIPDNVAEFCIL